MPVLQNKLHERFAWLVAEGETHTEAYRKIMPHVNAPHVLSHKVYHRPEVKSRIAEIQEEVNTRSVLAISRKREILRQMVEGTFPTKVVRNHRGQIMAIFDRLAALDMDAKLAGEYAPEKHEIAANNLRLTFKFRGRNTNASEPIEAEIVQETDEAALPAPAPEEPQDEFGTNADLSTFESAPMDQNQPQIDTI